MVYREPVDCVQHRGQVDVGVNGFCDGAAGVTDNALGDPLVNAGLCHHGYEGVPGFVEGVLHAVFFHGIVPFVPEDSFRHGNEIIQEGCEQIQNVVCDGYGPDAGSSFGLPDMKTLPDEIHVFLTE